MKRTLAKLFILLVAVVLLVFVPVVAYAAPAAGETMQEFSLDMIGSMAGLIAWVIFLTEASKFILPLIRVNLNPLIYCVIWAVIFMGARVLWVVPPSVPSDYFVAFINLVIVILTAVGGFEVAVKPLERLIVNAVVSRGTNTNPGDSEDAQ